MPFSEQAQYIEPEKTLEMKRLDDKLKAHEKNPEFMKVTHEDVKKAFDSQRENLTYSKKIYVDRVQKQFRDDPSGLKTALERINFWHEQQLQVLAQKEAELNQKLDESEKKRETDKKKVSSPIAEEVKAIAAAPAREVELSEPQVQRLAEKFSKQKWSGESGKSREDARSQADGQMFQELLSTVEKEDEPQEEGTEVREDTEDLHQNIAGRFDLFADNLQLAYKASNFKDVLENYKQSRVNLDFALQQINTYFQSHPQKSTFKLDYRGKSLDFSRSSQLNIYDYAKMIGAEQTLASLEVVIQQQRDKFLSEAPAVIEESRSSLHKLDAGGTDSGLSVEKRLERAQKILSDLGNIEYLANACIQMGFDTESKAQNILAQVQLLEQSVRDLSNFYSQHLRDTETAVSSTPVSNAPEVPAELSSPRPDAEPSSRRPQEVPAEPPAPVAVPETPAKTPEPPATAAPEVSSDRLVLEKKVLGTMGDVSDAKIAMESQTWSAPDTAGFEITGNGQYARKKTEDGANYIFYSVDGKGFLHEFDVQDDFQRDPQINPILQKSLDDKKREDQEAEKISRMEHLNSPNDLNRFLDSGPNLLLYIGTNDCHACEANKPVFDRTSASMRDVQFGYIHANEALEDVLQSRYHVWGEGGRPSGYPEVVCIKGGNLVSGTFPAQVGRFDNLDSQISKIFGFQTK